MGHKIVDEDAVDHFERRYKKYRLESAGVEA